MSKYGEDNWQTDSWFLKQHTPPVDWKAYALKKFTMNKVLKQDIEFLQQSHERLRHENDNLASDQIKLDRDIREKDRRIRSLEQDVLQTEARCEKTKKLRSDFHLLRSKEKSDKIAVLQAEVETMKWVIQNIRK